MRMLNKIVTLTRVARKTLKYCYCNDRNIQQFCNPPYHNLIIFVTPLFFMKKFYEPPAFSLPPYSEENNSP